MSALPLSVAPFSLHRESIDLPFIIESLCRFYVPKYEAEYRKFYLAPESADIRQAMAPMSREVVGLRTNEALIRVGHYSHVECITLDEVRNPRTRMGRDRRPLPWGKTRTLANGLYPFGWAKLEFLDFKADPRPKRKWPFLLEGERLLKIKRPKRALDSGTRGDISDEAIESSQSEDENAAKGSAVVLSPTEKLLDALSLIRPTDMGRLGTIIQRIETLETDAEKALIAQAIRDRIGSKAFRKHKRKEYLLGLIGKGGE